MNETQHNADAGSAMAEPDSGVYVDIVFGGRYRVTETLRKARNAEALSAIDLAHDGTVAVRLVPARVLSVDGKPRLEHQLELLRQVESAWLTTPIDFGQKDDVLYFVLPQITGDFLDLRLKKSPLQLREALAVGCCLFSALKDLHEHRTLHLNINPSNVVVDAHPLRKRATLQNLGLGEALHVEKVLADQPLDCAGAYKIESLGITLFERIETEDHTAITGLPLLAVSRMLNDLGIAIP